MQHYSTLYFLINKNHIHFNFTEEREAVLTENTAETANISQSKKNDFNHYILLLPCNPGETV